MDVGSGLYMYDVVVQNFTFAISSPDDLLYNSSAVAEMGDRLATIGMGRKWGGAAVGAGFPLGPHLTQCGLGRGLPLYQVTS